MRKLTVGEVANAAHGKIIRGNAEACISRVVTDSRTAEEGCLFVPLVAERDGHDFIPSAIRGGASAVIVHRDTEVDGECAVIRVEDTTVALGDIAKFYKEKYNVFTVAVTGSVGKTTTKDMVYTAISAGKRTIKTQKNFNNHIGVPLTVFTIEEDTEAAVIEMGMNHFGELEYLASIVKPDAAIITNIGMSHIENLGSREGIFKAKMEVAKNFGRDNTLILNGDDEYLPKVGRDREYKVIYYGINNPDNDVYARDIQNLGLDGTEFTAVDGEKEYRVRVRIPGAHNVYNALAAICAAKVSSVPAEAAVKAIEHTELTENRLETEEVDGKTLIKDYYNASPDSVRAALTILGYASDKRRVAVLGDILEMGEYAQKAHYELGEAVVKSGADMLVAAGGNAAFIAKGAKDCGMKNVHSFKTTEEACEFVRTHLQKNDAVLIKASHGMNFEKIYNTIKG